MWDKGFCLGRFSHWICEEATRIHRERLDSCVTDVGLCTKVVLDLMEGLGNTGLQLYTDNFYTSPLLYYRLYKHYGINACATVHPNRYQGNWI